MDKYVRFIFNNKEILIKKNSKINQTLAEEIIKYQQQGFGTRIIQKELNINRSTIQSFYKLNNLDNKDIRNLKAKPINKICKTCKLIKPISEFRKRKSYEPYCFECEKNINKIQCKKYYKKTKPERLKQIKEYYINNKEKYLKYNRTYRKIKRNIDITFKLRTNISNTIYSFLKKNKLSKNKSIIDKLPFKFEELKTHLESLFEPWMNWNNWSKFIKDKWDDDDSSTWTWQIDHIIPHSTFKYKSMDDELFIKCWSLNNLRPYSSKLNQHDGVTRIRHNLNK